MERLAKGLQHLSQKSAPFMEWDRCFFSPMALASSVGHRIHSLSHQDIRFFKWKDGEMVCKPRNLGSKNRSGSFRLDSL